MTVPSALQAQLLEVLAVDTEVIVTNRRIREAETALSELDTDEEYLRLVREAESAEDRVDDAQRECDHLASDIAAARARIHRDREREKTTNDPKELSDLEAEIRSLEIRIDMLEASELEAFQRREKLAEARDAVVRERDTFHESRDARAAALSTQISEAEELLGALGRQRVTLLEALPDEFVALYERQRERYGVGASFLHRGITSASGVQLSPSQLDEIRLTDPDTVIICPDSNAILIRTGDSGL